MYLQVVDKACHVTPQRAVIVLESDDIMKLTDLDAKNFVIKEASKRGLAVRGISGYSGPYLVTEDGNEAFSRNEIPAAELNKVAASGKFKYRNDYYVVSQHLAP